MVVRRGGWGVRPTPPFCDVESGFRDPGNDHFPGWQIARAALEEDRQCELSGIVREGDHAHVVGRSVQTVGRAGGPGFVGDDHAGGQQPFDAFGTRRGGFQNLDEARRRRCREQFAVEKATQKLDHAIGHGRVAGVRDETRHGRGSIPPALALAAVDADAIQAPVAEPRGNRGRAAADPVQRLDGGIVAVRHHRQEQFIERKAPLLGPAFSHLADLRSHVLPYDLDGRVARELPVIHHCQDVHGDRQFADAGRREALAAMQADVLARSQVQRGRSHGAVGFSRNLAPALGEGGHGRSGQACAE